MNSPVLGGSQSHQVFIPLVFITLIIYCSNESEQGGRYDRKHTI